MLNANTPPPPPTCPYCAQKQPKDYKVCNSCGRKREEQK